MNWKTRAVYRKGNLVLREPCDIPEDSEVELLIHDILVLHPEVTDPKKKSELLERVTDRMRQNPIPAGAPRLTREALHERR